MNTEQTLATFVAKLIDEKGLNGLDTEVKEQVVNDLLDRVEDRINAEILSHMPSDKVSEFNTVLDSGDEAAIQAFITSSVPDLDNIVAAALLAFRATYLGV
jgi:hypothetical protein